MPTALARTEPQRRTIPIWMIAVAVGVVSAILIAGYFYFFRQEYATLYRDLRPAAAASIVGELKKQRIPYRLGNGGAEILVPATDISSAHLALAGADLPVGGLNGFELFDSSDMGLTDFAQKIKFQRALQGELTRTILLINGVADARVHLSLPEKSLFRNEAATAKASVTLITRTSEPLAKAEIEGIQQLVASAIPDLHSQDVVVLNGRGKVVSERALVQTIRDSQVAQTNEGQTPEAKLETLLRQMLPTTQFQLRIEKVQAAKSAAAGAASSEPAAGGAEPSDAAQQQSPLPPSPQLKVTTDRRLSPEEQKLVQATIVRAAVLAAGTPLTFSEGLVAQPQVEAPGGGPVADLQSPVESAASRPVDQPAAPASPITAPAPLISTPGSSVILAAGGLVIAIGFVIGVGLLLARRTAGPSPRLAIEDQSRFAERLKAGLAAEEQDSPHAA